MLKLSYELCKGIPYERGVPIIKNMTVLEIRMFHVKQYDVNGMIRIGETQINSCNYPPSQL